MSTDINPEQALMLGCSAWSDHDWAVHYFPEDLPPDWRLAYFANDFDCAVVEAAQWRGKLEDFTRMVGEADDDLQYFVVLSDDDAEIANSLLALIGDRRSVVLSPRALPLETTAAQWLATNDGGWADPTSDGRVQRWVIERYDLRDLRDRVTALPHGTRALWLDGPGFSPDHLAEIRTLLQLMGRV